LLRKQELANQNLTLNKMKKIESEKLSFIIGGKVSSSACFFAPAALIVSIHGGGFFNSSITSLMSACWNDHD